MSHFHKHIYLLLFFALLSLSALGQNKIRITGAKMESAREVCKSCIRFKSSPSKRVVIKQRGTRIECDLAIQDAKSNTAEAFGNIKIFRSDSKYPLQGDKLYLDGNTNVARLRENVFYQDEDMAFTTEKFNYNTKTEEGYYFDGGIVEDSINTLESLRGYLFKNNDIIVKDSVVVTTPDYIVYSDSVKYNSVNEIVYIIAPTTFVSDSSTLYTEAGYYDTKAAYAYLTKNSKLQEAHQSMEADTLTYLENEMIGEAFGNIFMNDTVQMLILKGNYSYHNGMDDYSMVTDSAQMLLYSGIDTLFAHADTLTSYVDTAGVQYMSGHRNVRFFRLDVQGKCDSLSYCLEDSVTTMYYQPMLWSLYNQMNGDVIKIYSEANQLSHFVMLDHAFLASREDSLRFNQVSGKKITGYINSNSLDRIQVDGGAQSIYYSREDEYLVGYNQTESDYLTINMENGLVKRLALQPASSGQYFSLDSRPYSEQFLRGFQWRSDLRPVSPEDIFRRTPPEETKKRRRK